MTSQLVRHLETRLTLLVMTIAVVISTPATAAEYNQAFSMRMGYLELGTVASNYNPATISSLVFAGEYSFSNSRHIRYKGVGMGSLSGEILKIGFGANYHIIPFYLSTTSLADNIQVTNYPKWSPYVGVDIGLSRVQLTLAKTTGGGARDVVLGGLFGPTISGGTYYFVTRNWLAQAEGSYFYGFSPALAASGYTITAGMTFFFH